MFSPVTISHRAYFNLLPDHDSILFSLSLKQRKAWWSNYIHILHKWLNANCDWLQEIRTSPVTVRRMSMKAAESQRVSSPLRNLPRLVPRLPGGQAEWWDGRRKGVERIKKKKKEKKGKKWEEDVNQRRFTGDANCSRGHHHRQEQHQTAWLTFQHSCHVEEASRPKAQNKNLCDAQGNVFYIVTRSHLIAVFLMTSPELFISRSDHGSIMRQSERGFFCKSCKS